MEGASYGCTAVLVYLSRSRSALNCPLADQRTLVSGAEASSGGNALALHSWFSWIQFGKIGAQIAPKLMHTKLLALGGWKQNQLPPLLQIYSSFQA